MTTANSKAIEEAQIRKLIDDRVKAVRAKDVNGAMSNYVPDVLLFDVVNPLPYAGSDAARKRAAEWFSTFEGPIGYEVRDLNIARKETRDVVTQDHNSVPFNVESGKASLDLKP